MMIMMMMMMMMIIIIIIIQVNFTLEQATKAQTGSRCIALLFL
jgi:hypothetical protein